MFIVNTQKAIRFRFLSILNAVRLPKIVSVICILIFAIAFFSECANSDDETLKDPRGKKYAGADACVSCHKNIFSSYTNSNHFKTSTKMDHVALSEIMPDSVHFNFQDSSQVLVERHGSSFNQSLLINGQKKMSYQCSIAFGSGEKAQTFAYWQDGKLMQLPLSYFTTNKTWANSPGFPTQYARFNRVIESRCFECHASFIDKEMVQSGPVSVSEKLNQQTVIYGIDCERCHGPAAEHVDYQLRNPLIKEAKYIKSVKGLNRQQQLDLCGVCHAGNDLATQKTTFGFKPGDSLRNFYFPSFGQGVQEADVHGKQMQLLQTSACFQKTNMTCSTCHDPHKNEKNSIETFITKCVNCHEKSKHVTEMVMRAENRDKNGRTIKTNCIDCHMPTQPSKIISFSSSAGLKRIPYLLRTHKIAVYQQN